MSLNQLVALAAFATAGLAPAFAGDAGVDYPERFRSFQHVTTGIVTPGFVFNGVDLGAQVPGLHNIYANPAAIRGYRRLTEPSGGSKTFSNGSVIVFDLWEPGSVDAGTGSFTFQNRRLAVAVMEKHSRKYAATGGWGFQVFDPVSGTPLLGPEAQRQCFACHEITPGTDFVFSKVSN